MHVEMKTVALGAFLIVIAVVGIAAGVLLTSLPPGSNGGGGNDDDSGLTPDTDLFSQDLEAPDWNLIMSDGSLLSLESLEGKFVIVDLMTTSCPACETQNEHLKTLYEDHSDSMTLLTLNVDLSATTSIMADYKESRDLDWYVGIDSNGVFSSYFSLRYTPTVAVIDPDGYFRMFHEGVWEADDIVQTVSLMDR